MTENIEERALMCVNHVRTMSMAYVPDCELVCRNCSGYNTLCEDYKPYNSNYQIPVRKGIVAYNMGRRE